MKKSERPNGIPKLDFDSLGFKDAVRQKPKVKVEGKVATPILKSSARNAQAIEAVKSSHRTQRGSKTSSSQRNNNVKPQPNEKQYERQVVYENKQVFYKDVQVNGSLSNRGSKGPKEKFWYMDDHKPVEVTSRKEEDEGCLVDQVAQLQTEYVNTPYKGIHGAMKSAADLDVSKKQENEVMEQVLIDLLSRHVISDVEQDHDPARQNPADPTTNSNTAPLRNKSRRLHDTKVSTVGAVTESKLKDRITFGARILTRDGRDALRQLFGFYFQMDSSLTVYEFRLFGKKNLKALPLIERGVYRHINGRHKGKLYDENDFQLGRNITFTTRNQPRLPESIKRSDTLTIRVSEINGSSSSSNPYDDLSSHRSDLEFKDRKITEKVQKLVRESLVGRGVSVVIGLGQLFRRLDRSGDGKLNREELSQALTSFNICLSGEDFESVWRVVDENNDGAINYGEFLRAFIGEMNEDRKSLVRKVFRKLDPHKSGAASMLDVRKLYSAKKHPFVSQGLLTQAEMEDTFVRSLTDVITSREQLVSFVEFEEYYEGLSLSVKNDNDFANILRNCWGI